ncbi:MAG: hypothetical protein WAW09_06870 [Smithella sp.]
MFDERRYIRQSFVCLKNRLVVVELYFAKVFRRSLVEQERIIGK